MLHYTTDCHPRVGSCTCDLGALQSDEGGPGDPGRIAGPGERDRHHGEPLRDEQRRLGTVVSGQDTRHLETAVIGQVDQPVNQLIQPIHSIAIRTRFTLLTFRFMLSIQHARHHIPVFETAFTTTSLV